MSDELRVSPKRMQSAGEELANSVSHGIGLCAALIGAPILLLEARRSSPGFFLGTVIFVITMSMLYLGSTLYHAWPQTRGKSVLQTLDHSAIFLLIAGTYTPFTLGPLRGFWGSTMLALVWALAISGVFLKTMRGPSRHPKLSYRGSPDDVGDSIPCPVLACSGRHCLHHWRALFRERAFAVQSFHLAFVRPGWFELPFSCGSLLLRVKRGSRLNRSDFSRGDAGDWTRGIDRRINPHAAGGA